MSHDRIQEAKGTHMWSLAYDLVNLYRSPSIILTDYLQWNRFSGTDGKNWNSLA